MMSMGITPRTSLPAKSVIAPAKPLIDLTADCGLSEPENIR